MPSPEQVRQLRSRRGLTPARPTAARSMAAWRAKAAGAVRPGSSTAEGRDIPSNCRAIYRRFAVRRIRFPELIQPLACRLRVRWQQALRAGDFSGHAQHPAGFYSLPCCQDAPAGVEVLRWMYHQRMGVPPENNPPGEGGRAIISLSPWQEKGERNILSPSSPSRNGLDLPSGTYGGSWRRACRKPQRSESSRARRRTLCKR